MKNNVVMMLKAKREFFTGFESAYLFGSFEKTANPNDIDILLVYEKLSSAVEMSKMKLQEELEKIVDISIHLTVMSREEIIETDFLAKIGMYKKIF